MIDIKEELSRVSREFGVTAEFFEEINSTNDLARDRKYRHGDLIVAGIQTAGRGQRGNKWSSEAGANLTFSMVIEPVFLPAECQFFLSEAVSLAVTDMLGEYGLDPSVKWTNDIYIGDSKLAGILIENDIRGANLVRSIIGIGINVNQTDFPDWLPNPVSMMAATGRRFNVGEVLGSFYFAFQQRYKGLELGFTGKLENDYHQLLYRKDQPHVYKLPDSNRFVGIIRQVMPTGELMVEHADGSVKGYLFKEIEFVL